MLFCNYFVNFIAYDLKNKYPIYIENIGYFRKYRYIYQLCTELTSVITSVCRQTNMCVCQSGRVSHRHHCTRTDSFDMCACGVLYALSRKFSTFSLSKRYYIVQYRRKNTFSFCRDCQLPCCHSAPFSLQNTCSRYFSLHFLL